MSIIGKLFHQRILYRIRSLRVRDYKGTGCIGMGVVWLVSLNGEYIRVFSATIRSVFRRRAYDPFGRLRWVGRDFQHCSNRRLGNGLGKSINQVVLWENKSNFQNFFCHETNSCLLDVKHESFLWCSASFDSDIDEALWVNEKLQHNVCFGAFFKLSRECKGRIEKFKELNDLHGHGWPAE